MDRETKNRLQRERRLKSNNVETKRYEKTINGFLMRLYRNMKSRISGVQKEKYHLYVGKELLNKDEFYEWAKSNDTFLVLFDEYKKNEYDRRLAPSVDRVDSSKGYELSNMEFVTHSENSRRGSLSKLRCNGKNRPPSAL
jgi:hypothetical protein